MMIPMRGNVSLDLCNLVKKYCEDGESNIDTKIFNDESANLDDEVIDNSSIEEVDTANTVNVTDNVESVNVESYSFIDKLIGNDSGLSLEEQLKRSKKKKANTLDDKDVQDLLSNSSELINSIKQSEIATGETDESSIITTEGDVKETDSGVSEESSDESSKESNYEASTETNPEATVEVDTEVSEESTEEDACKDEDEDEEYNIAYEFSKCVNPSDTLDVIRLLKTYGYTINVNNEIGACAISELIYVLETMASAKGIELGYSEYISHNVSNFKKSTADAITAMYDVFSKNGDDDYNKVLMELSFEVD